MKLTNHMRDMFVQAVLNDIPQINYVEKAHNLIKTEMKLSLPPKVREIFDNKDLKGYLKNKQVYIYKRDVYSFNSVEYPANLDFIISPETEVKLVEWNELRTAQDVSINNMRDQLTALIGGCTTAAKAKINLPEELHKYLPQVAELTKNVPMVTNVVESLTALGFPKGAELKIAA